jgi:predicted RNA methylase
LHAGSDEVFLDIGSGAGRMTCAAARHPFGRVIGLEISPPIVELARRNILSLKGRQAPCEMICTDAQHYEIPDDVTIIFMYNPFGETIFQSTLTQIVSSYDRKPRRMRLVYANPREHLTVMSHGRFRLFRRIHLSWRPSPEWRRTQTVQIYEVVPHRYYRDIKWQLPVTNSPTLPHSLWMISYSPIEDRLILSTERMSGRHLLTLQSA